MPSPNPALIDVVSSNFSGTSTPTLVTSPLTQVGDLLVVAIYASTVSFTAITLTPSTGWVGPVRDLSAGTGGEFDVYYKLSTINGSETLTFNWASVIAGCLVSATLRGVYAAVPNIFPVLDAEASGATSWTLPTQFVYNDFVGVLVFGLADDTTSETWSLAPSLPQQTFAYEPSFGQVLVWYDVQLAAGTSTAYVASKTGAGSDGAILAFYVSQDPLVIVAPGSSGTVALGLGPYTGPNIVVTGGTPGYTLSMLSGGLPAGLSFDTSTGVISGTVTGMEPSSFTVQVVDSQGQTRSIDGEFLTYETAPPVFPNGPSMVGDLLPDFIGQTTDMDGGQGLGPNVQLPPFKWTDGNVYIAHTNIMTDGSFRQFLAVGRSSNPNTVAFASVDAANAPEVGDNSPPCPILDLPNSRILFLVADGTVKNPPLNTPMSVRVFNLATGLWDTPMATGGPNVYTVALSYNNFFVIAFRQTSPTTFLVVYSSFHAFQNPDIYCVTLTTAGVWGTPAPILLSVLAPTVEPVFCGMAVDGNGVTWVLYFQGGSGPFRHDLYYVPVSLAGVVGSPVMIYTNTFGDTPQERAPGFGTYIPAIDSVVWGFYDFSLDSFWITPSPPNDISLLMITNVSTAPAAVFEGIANNSNPLVGRNGLGAPYFFQSPDLSTWYVAVEQITDSGGSLGFGNQSIVLFSRPASGTPGSWAGPATYYDSTINPPPGPVYHNSPDGPTPPAELNSLSFAFIDGAMVTTVGMLSDWCGVIFYLSMPPDCQIVVTSGTQLMPQFYKRGSAHGA